MNAADCSHGISILDMSPVPPLRVRLSRALRRTFFCRRDIHRETVASSYDFFAAFLAYECVDCGWETRRIGQVRNVTNLPTPDDTDAIQAMVDRGEPITERTMRLTRPLTVNDWLKPVLFSHNKVRTSAHALFVGTFPQGSELSSCDITAANEHFVLVDES